MLNPAATLEEGGPNVTQAANDNQVQLPKGSVMKFAYATGSRPLDGYTIKRGVGVGGFGDVYFAISDAGKEVALKRVQRSMDVEVRGVSQCLNLKHINLISLFDIKYDDEGQAWVVMEYITGESLKDVIDRNPSGMPLSEVEDWFGQIASGVTYLHDHGIVHRDLKPGNIFVDEDIVKIGDYGLSKYISCSRRSGQTESVGTFHYMAPEIGKGVYGKEIDVYALGIMLYEMLCGSVPFEGESSQEIIMKHLTAEPNVDAVAERFRPVIRKALFKDPEQRYSSITDMLRAFNSLGVPTSFASNDKIPPVRIPVAEATETLYIMDESEGIELGPLKEAVPVVVVNEPKLGAQPVAPRPEPIANAVRQGSSNAMAWWRDSKLSMPLKLLLILGIAVVFVFNSGWLVPLGVVLGAAYLIYFGIYSLVTVNGGPPTRATPRHAANAEPTPTQRRRNATIRKRKWRQIAQDELRSKHGTERLTELNGSFLVSAIAASLLGFVMLQVGNIQILESTTAVYAWSLYAWLAITCAACSWAILAVGKKWEGHDGRPLQRRFAMLLVGLVMGGLAFATSEFLDVRRAGFLSLDSMQGYHNWSTMYGVDGQPDLPVFMIHFAAMFFLPSWWQQADPLRRSRLSVFRTGGCVLIAWILHIILPFPQPWGIMLAAALSVAVQLSSPHVTTRNRERFQQQALQG
ncbi:MAG TPA: serine/threonine-protein kinase [Pirellulaceae bacterium]|nr:serine/threonine-protein kinase [Pirellulaceae bacterium]